MCPFLISKKIFGDRYTLSKMFLLNNCHSKFFYRDVVIGEHELISVWTKSFLCTWRKVLEATALNCFFLLQRLLTILLGIEISSVGLIKKTYTNTLTHTTHTGTHKHTHSLTHKINTPWSYQKVEPTNAYTVCAIIFTYRYFRNFGLGAEICEDLILWFFGCFHYYQ